MKAELHPNARAQFEVALETPFPLTYMQRDEFWRRIKTLEQTPTSITLLLDLRAVGLLDLDGDTATNLRIVEGEPALKIIERVGYQVSEEELAVAKKVLVPGADPEQALAAGLTGRRAGPYSRLPVRPDEQGHVIRIADQANAVLEVQLDAAGKVASHAWLRGVTGWLAFNKSLYAKTWAAEDFPGGVREARDHTQAALFIAVQQGVMIDDYEVDGGWVALARTPDGGRRFQFIYADSAAAKALLEPTALVTFAASVLETATKARSQGRQSHGILLDQQIIDASAAIREALKLIPAGQASVPAALITSRVGQRMNESQPDFFAAKRLGLLASKLDVLK